METSSVRRLLSAFSLWNKTHRVSLFGIINIGLALYAVLSGLKLLAYAYNIIRASFPLELREGAILSTTHLLLENRNPFTAENLPQYLNGYGIIYNLTTVPFARLFGDTFPVHRLLTGIYLGLAILFLIWVMGRKKALPLFAITAGLCVLANQLYSVTPLTRPDGLGFLLYVLAALLPWDQNFSRLSLVVSAILGVLAFYTKLYFFLAVVFVAAYLFLRVSKRLALFYTGLSALLLLLAALLLNWFYPYYFYATFFMAVYQPIYHVNHMIWQFQHLCYLYAGMLVILLLVIITGAKPFIQKIRTIRLKMVCGSFDIRHLSEPLLAFPLNYPLMSLVIAIMAIALKLGGHNGSKMVYLFHLISPLLVVVVVQQANQINRLRVLVCLLFGLALVLNLRQLGLRPFNLEIRPAALINNPDRFMAEWTRVEKILKPHTQVLNSPLIAGILLEDDKPVVDNGHSQFFHARNVPDSFFLPPTKQIYSIDEAFRRDIIWRVRHHTFDLVMIDRNESPFIDQETLSQFYQMEQEVDLYAIQNRKHFQLEVWIPK